MRRDLEDLHISIEMMDTRFNDPPNNEWKKDIQAERRTNDQVPDSPYLQGLMKGKGLLQMASAVNYDYCKRHGYEFRVHGNIPNMVVAPTWYKIPLMRSWLKSAKERKKPSLFVFVDSDSYFVAPQVSLESWITQTGLKLEGQQWSFMMTSEQDFQPFGAPLFEHGQKEGVVMDDMAVDGGVKAYPNGGVILAYIDPNDEVRMASFEKAINTWALSICEGGPDALLENNHRMCCYLANNVFHEQGCLHGLLYHKRWPQSIRDTMSTALYIWGESTPSNQWGLHAAENGEEHMSQWNGPWGQYIRHIWGHPQHSHKRTYALHDHISAWSIDVEKLWAAINVMAKSGEPLVFDERVNNKCCRNVNGEGA
jgi:hypothetical protein